LLPEAISYARMMMFAMPVLLVFILYTQILRGVSDTLRDALLLRSAAHPTELRPTECACCVTFTSEPGQLVARLR